MNPGSIPDEVIRICHWLFTGGTIALQSTQPLNRNECQQYFLGGKGGWCLRLTPLPLSCADLLEILGTSTSCGLKGLLGLCRDSSNFWIYNSNAVVGKNDEVTHYSFVNYKIPTKESKCSSWFYASNALANGMNSEFNFQSRILQQNDTNTCA